MTIGTLDHPLPILHAALRAEHRSPFESYGAAGSRRLLRLTLASRIAVFAALTSRFLELFRHVFRPISSKLTESAPIPCPSGSRSTLAEEGVRHSCGSK